MKTVILVGGFGTRLAEETTVRPKPMVEIGGRPILWHIMNIYAAYGFKEFVLACGYKGEIIKEYFRGFHFHDADLTIDLKSGDIHVHSNRTPDWRVTLLDTGIQTQTGGRIKRCRQAIGNETFLATYGDGVGDVNIGELLKFHRSHGRLATVTAVRPPARFGELTYEGDQVLNFSEKPQTGAGWINGGFYVFEPGVFDYIESDSSALENQPLPKLAKDGQLMAFWHKGFWQPMDTLREKHLLETMWQEGKAPWKVW